MNENVKPCPHCSGETDLYTPEKVAVLAMEIPIAMSLASEEKVLNNRIKTCKSCEALKEEVLCAYCGCFVLFRARTRKNYCPHPNGNRWEDF